MSASEPKHRLETQLVHAGEPLPRIAGAVAMPIFQSSTFVYSGEESYHDVRYIRLNNTPNHQALAGKLAAIEGGQAAVVAASGMAAISTSLFALLKAGDHVLIQRDLYGGTHDFVTRDLTRFGVEHTFVDGSDPSSWEAAIRPTTRVLYVETIANPLLRVADLEAAVAFARARGLVSMVDNTFASPVNFRPLERGFDLSLHSGTKYLNGHSDIVAGAVIGRGDLVERIKHQLDHLGGSLDPHACFLLQRGMKTLALRVRYQNDSALAIARFLEAHPAVLRVHYPGLPSHPHHARAKALFDGAGGMVAFELKGGVEAAARLIERLTVPVHAPSLGGIETLITRPATTSHAGLSAEERQQVGISDALIRLSVGLEATEDLIADFTRSLG
ncbi:trans-sulfuration enzyme family protein [Polyangium aurulentum]|uniref:trans-sulfuration enzyme family protein n=1 Tax=Polyangium aurulentum TaxID=2567896 RepID=UPI0010ADF0C1|nr:aminotransferase class I/II-fold pyridoxal phosphate-dependent enzyme [Polyangium aurulentum]UQA57558.1 aminotransferase class I/II-fold pyridoxal phosphate-dependent enzyme [Polyangium aurulentum]